MSSTVAEVHAFLDRWHAAAAASDFDSYFGSMTEDAHWLGTDATENWDKTSFAAFAKPYFDKGQAWSFTAVERNVYVSRTGTMAWFDEVLDTWMKGCRGSGVVERMEDGQWKVHHYVLSMTIPNGEGKEQLNREVIPFKSKYEDEVLAKLRANPKRN
ncbi:SnoaL-like domain containing protein [Novymonas esmeraldas]|uniref:SnoaL-like domain containing protein n=1 Tax=Novymonas esmeraldas TaxID=1808958 RepID=A0AAW0EJJ3_9TRYP